MRLKLTTIPAPGSVAFIGRKRFPGYLWAVFDKHEEARTGALRPIRTFSKVEDAERFLDEATA